MLKLVCWLTFVVLTADPFFSEAREPAAALDCRPSSRDGSGFGLESRVGAGRVSLCGDVLLKLKPAPPAAKPEPMLAPKPAPRVIAKPMPISQPAPPVVHPKGWVNRWSRTVVVRPAPLAARVVATRVVGVRLIARLASSASVHYKRGWLLGRSIVVRFTPTAWSWSVDHRRHFGRRTTVVNVPTGAIHSAVAQVHFAADVRLATSKTWMRQRGRIVLAAKPVWFGKSRAWHARVSPGHRTYFVAFDCTQHPTGIGC